jgi:hypothetical protein
MTDKTVTSSMYINLIETKTNMNLISLFTPYEIIIMRHNQGPTNNKMTLK